MALCRTGLRHFQQNRFQQKMLICWNCEVCGIVWGLRNFQWTTTAIAKLGAVRVVEVQAEVRLVSGSGVTGLETATPWAAFKFFMPDQPLCAECPGHGVTRLQGYPARSWKAWHAFKIGRNAWPLLWGNAHGYTPCRCNSHRKEQNILNEQ